MTRIAYIACAACVVAAWMGWQDTATAQKRVALVVGNSAYHHTARLDNPKNDATDMAAALQQLGFEVVAGFDLDKAAFDRKVRDFAEVIERAQLALFFYAGHGLQVAGQNYLVPVDAKLAKATALDFETVRLDLVQRTMEREVNTNIIMLDACRDNPLARNLARSFGTRSGAIGQGLASMESGEGTLISFSTQPGNVALDGIGRNSPFAAAMLKHIIKPGDDLPTILINVRNDVMAATERRQIPWEHSALTAKVYFTPPKPAGPTPEQQFELVFWASVKDSTNPAVLATYLERYPNGEFALIARTLIAHYEHQLKVDIAEREQQRKREEEARKAAEVARLEIEQRARETELAEERRRAEAAKNSAEATRLEETQRAELLARREELRKAAEDARKAQEDAKAAEQQRLAALRAAEEATKAAEAAIAKKKEAEKGVDPTRLAALPKLEQPQRQHEFDGLWQFHRSSANCGQKSWIFVLRIANGSASGWTGQSKIVGSVSASGQLRFSHGGTSRNVLDGSTVSYTGTLRAGSASGQFYKGPDCSGTFTAKRG